MSMTDILSRKYDDEMYNHPGKTATVQYGVRKYRDRPAINPGDVVTIVRFHTEMDNYGWRPRLLLQLPSGVQRWVDASIIDPQTVA